MFSVKNRSSAFVNIFMTVEILAVFALLISCSNDSDTGVQPTGPTAVSLEINGFGPLVSGSYEAWVVHQADYTSLGKFNLGANGETVDMTGQPISQFASSADLSTASRIAVTIEPANDTDNNPSAVEILTGLVAGDTLALGFQVNYTGRSGN